MMKSILNNRKVFSIALVLIGVLGTFIPPLCIAREKSVENIYYFSQIVSAIFVISGICLLVCIITARAVSSFHVQEMVLFSVSAVYLAVFIGVNRKKVLK